MKKASGINWGLQKGHSKKGTGYVEAYIPLFVEHIDNNPIMFPFFPSARTTSTGKTTRRYDTVTVLWDDGVVMEMVFSGNGVERPAKGKRKPGEPYHQYPKQLTSGKDGDGGGAVLGEYLRKRMNISERKLVTLSDLKIYKRDYIELRYISPGYYEADFSGTPIKTK